MLPKFVLVLPFYMHTCNLHGIDLVCTWVTSFTGLSDDIFHVIYKLSCKKNVKFYKLGKKSRKNWLNKQVGICKKTPILAVSIVVFMHPSIM